MSAIWPSAIAQSSDLLVAVNNTKVTLTVDAGIGDTTLTVDDASQLPSSGYLTFDDNATSPETIFYSGRTTNNLTGVTRAADGTTASTHSSSGGLTHIEQRWNAAFHNVLSTEIIAIEQNLSDRFGVDTGSHVVKIVDGAVGAPALTFAADSDTGLYRIGANDLAITTAGTKALEVNATQQVVIPKTSSQLILGTTNTVTISSTAPSASRTLTIPDPGGAANFVLDAGNYTIGGTWTFSNSLILAGFTSSVALTVTPTTNQLVLGTTRTVTISATQPASTSRTWTIPDISGNGTFAALEGTQTFSGTKTFNAFTGTLSSNLAAGGFKLTGLGAGSSNGDSLRYENVFQTGTTTLLGPLQIPHTTTDATTDYPLNLNGSKLCGFGRQQTASVAGSATTIILMNNDTGLLLVSGTKGTAAFIDLLLVGSGHAPTVISSFSAVGSPDTRTYTSSGFSQKLAMSAGTYTINVLSIEFAI